MSAASAALDKPSSSPRTLPKLGRRLVVCHLRLRAEPGVVVAVRRADIVALPALLRAALARRRVEPCDRAFVCDAFARTGTCDAGNACPDAHVKLRRAKRLTPHVAAAATNTPRLPANLGTIRVAPVRERGAGFTVDASACLATAAAIRDDVPASICVHFERNGVCDYGAECGFVHVLAPDHTRHAHPSDSMNHPYVGFNTTADSLPSDSGRPASHAELPTHAFSTTAIGSGTTGVVAAHQNRRDHRRFVHDPYALPAPGWQASRSGARS